MGTPQGGIISPTLANIALDGLDALLAPWKKRSSNKVNYVRYADDFIITASSKELIEKEILPVVTTFFAERGLTLSTEKTIITPISEGFDFLGQTLRKFKEKLIIKPSKKSIKAILEKLRGIIDKNKATSAYELIAQLNPVIRGWCNYHKHASSKKIFDQIDTALFHSLWHWAKRRHHNKNLGWIANKYFGHLGNRNWHFFGAARLAKGEPLTKKWLFLAARTPIIRHIKIQKTMNPYDPKDAKYFATRKAKLAKRNARFSELGYGDIDNENDWFTYVPGIVTTTALSNARLRV
jgi:RNA-directed DNA polymerase